MAKDKVKVKITADDKEYNEALKRAGDTAKKSFAAIGVAAAAAIASVIKFGSEFEQSAAKASTLFGDVAVDTENLNQKMLELSSSTGVAAAELNEGLYSALSAGIPVTEDMASALDMLESSAKLAIAGFTDTDTAIAATAKTLNAYGLDVSETERVQGILIQTQNKGITTVNELGQYLAQVTPTAAAFGVSFENVGAALATMTAQGTPTATATTQLKTLIAELGKEGTVASDSLSAAAKGSEYAGMSFKEMMDSGAELSDVLGLIQKHADENGVSLVDMFSSIEAGSAALSIMNKEGTTFTSNLEAMNDTAGLVEAGYSKMVDTASGQTAILKESLKNLAITAYNSLDGSFTELLKSVNGAIAGIAASLQSGALGSALNFLIRNFDILAISAAGAWAAIAAYKGIVAASAALAALKATIVAYCTAQVAAKTVTSGSAIAITAETGVVKLATIAQAAWNKVVKAHPFAFLVSAIMLAITAIVAITSAMKKEKSEAEVLGEEIAELTARIDENRKANEEAREARKKAVSEIESEYGHYESLVEELDSLVDANGNVKEGYEDRANAITGILSDALGTEITLDSMVAQGKQAIIDNIYSLIEAKKQEALVSAYQEDYNKALKEEDEITRNYTDAVVEQEKAQRNYRETLTKLQNEYPAIIKMQKETGQSWSDMHKNLNASGEGNEVLKELAEWETALKSANKTLFEANDAMVENKTVQENYEFLLGAIASGEAEKIDAAFLRIKNSFKTADVSTREVLTAQAVYFGDTVASMERALENGAPGVTQKMVDELRTLYNLSVVELDRWAELNKDKSATAVDNLFNSYSDNLLRRKGIPVAAVGAVTDDVEKTLDSVDGAGAGSKAVDEYAGGISAGAGEAQSASALTAESAGIGFGSVSMATQGMAATESYSNGILENSMRVIAAAHGINQTTEDNLRSNMSPTGVFVGTTYSKGLGSTKGMSASSAKSLADAASSNSELNLYSTGMNIGQSLANGIRAMIGTVASAAAAMTNAASSVVNTILQINSPSKIMIAKGRSFGKGFAMGIQNSKTRVDSAAKGMARGAISALNKTLRINSPSLEGKESGKNFGEGVAEGIDATRAKVGASAKELANYAVKSFNHPLSIVTQDHIRKLFENGLSGGLKETEENNKKNFDAYKAVLETKQNYGLISEEEYYEGLSYYRDQYLKEGSKEWFDATDEIIDYREKTIDEALKYEREKLDRMHRIGMIDDAEYYAGLEKIRDTYLKKGSDGWYEYTEEILEYNEEVAEEAAELAKEKAEEITEAARENFKNVLDESKNFAKKLSDVGNPYDTDAIIGVEYHWSEDGRVLTENAVKGIAPADLNAQAEKINQFGENIKALKGKVPAEMFEYLRELSVEDGIKFTDALLAYSEDEFNAYIEAWENKRKAVYSVTAELYGEEAVKASLAFKEALEAEADVELPEKFFEIGTDAGTQFSNAFMGKIHILKSEIESAMSNMYNILPMDRAVQASRADNVYAPTYILQAAEGESTVRQVQTIQNAETQKRLGNWR